MTESANGIRDTAHGEAADRGTDWAQVMADEDAFIRHAQRLLRDLEAVAGDGVPVLEVMVRRDPPECERGVVYRARIDKRGGRDYGHESAHGMLPPVDVLVRSLGEVGR